MDRSDVMHLVELHLLLAADGGSGSKGAAGSASRPLCPLRGPSWLPTVPYDVGLGIFRGEGAKVTIALSCCKGKDCT